MDRRTDGQLVDAYARVPAFSWVYCQPASHSSKYPAKKRKDGNLPASQSDSTDLDFEHTLDAGLYLGTIVWQFGGDPVICQNVNPLDGEPETYFSAK